MNKLFTKIAVAFVGMAMAVGVGVAVGGRDEAQMAKAVSEHTMTFDFEDSGAHRSEGNNSYSSDPNAYEENEVNISLTYSDSVTSGSPLTGSANIMGRIAKNTTNSPVVKIGSFGFISGTTVTGVSYNIKGVAAMALALEYSTNNSTWTSIQSIASGSMPTTKTSKSVSSLSISATTFYLRWTISVATSTGSNRDFQLDDIVVSYTSPTLVSSISLTGTGLGGTSTTATISIPSNDVSGHSITATINDADTKALTVVNSNDSIAEVSGLTNGKITPILDGGIYKASFTITGQGETSGSTTVTITATDGSGVYSTLTITATDSSASPLSSVSVSGTPSVAIQYEGDTFIYTGLSFTAHFEDESTDSVDGGDVVWDALVADTNPTGSLTINGVTKSVIVTSVSVIEKLNAIVGNTATLVTNAGTLSSGDRLLIVSTETNKVLAPYDGTSNYYSYVNGSLVSSILTPSAGYAELTLGGSKDAWTLYDGEYYIASASNSSNNMKGSATATTNATWSISISDGVASLVANGTYTRNVMQWNNTSGQYRFTCYSSASQTDVSLYKLTTYNNINSAAQKGALDFVKTFNSTLDSACIADGSADLTSAWSTISSAFTSNRTSSGQATTYNNIFKFAKATKRNVETGEANTGDSLQNALARYDWIVAHHDECADFLNTDANVARAAVSASNNINPISYLSTESNNTVLIVTVLSISSLIAIGGYLFIRKRKEDK